MGQRTVITTGLWPITINKEEIISSSFICMGQVKVCAVNTYTYITGLWIIHINEEEMISSLFMVMGQRPVVITGLWSIAYLRIKKRSFLLDLWQWAKGL